MLKIYYHIYAIDGVLDVVYEQFSLIEKYFNFEYELNIGICSSSDNDALQNVINYLKTKKCTIRGINNCQSEWVTLNLIESDKITYNDTDIIVYFHTKGISHIVNEPNIYKQATTWRKMMDYFFLERIADIVNILSNSVYNIYGVSKHMYDWEQKKRPGHFHMTANYWGVTGKYAKTIDTTIGNRNIRTDVENRFWQLGSNPLPYEAYTTYNKNNIETIYFKREDYEIK
jgi:hypothetical protein